MPITVRRIWILPPSWKAPAPSPCEARAGRGLGRGAASIELARLIGIPSPLPSPHSSVVGRGNRPVAWWWCQDTPFPRAATRKLLSALALLGRTRALFGRQGFWRCADAHRCSGGERIRRIQNDAIRRPNSFKHFDDLAEVPAQRDAAQFDLLVGVDETNLHPFGAEEQRVRRQRQRCFRSSLGKAHLGITA